MVLSTTEAKYISVTEAVKESIWLQGIMLELGVCQECVIVNCDSQSVIHLTNHQVFHDKSKHINVKNNFVRDVLVGGSIEVQKIPTEENPADQLPIAKFRRCPDFFNS